MFQTKRKFVIIIILTIFTLFYGIFSYLNNLNEKNIKQSLLEQREVTQRIVTKSVANNIDSDLKIIMTTFKGLGNSEIIQKGLFSDNKSKQLMNESYFQINSIIDRLFLVDQNGIIKENIVPNGENRFIGSNLTAIDNWALETTKFHKAGISSGFIGLDGKLRFAITNPIQNRETGQYMGFVGAVVPVEKFFSRYGNIFDINSEFINIYNNEGEILVSPRTFLIGKNVFSQQVQQFYKHDETFNRILNEVLNGKASKGIYNVLGKEFLNTGYPVIRDNKTIFAVSIVTQTSDIISSISNLLFLHSLEIFLLLIVLTSSVTILLMLLMHWQKDIHLEVDKRTIDLKESNNRLEIINEKQIANEKAKEEFISMVSHELRTPLTPIKAFSQMLLKPKYMGGAILNEKQRRAVNSIISNVILLERLIGDVLDTYKIDLNRLKITKTSISVEQLINQNILNFKSRAYEKDIILEQVIKTKKDTHVYCDINRIGQVFSNLINNSIDFLPAKNGKITLVVENNKENNVGEKGGNSQYVTFTIEDNGIGIPPDKIDNLFKKFYQIDTSDTRKHGGTGLGLVICKGIIEAHGGKIWFDKNYINGASVKFTLPVIENINLSTSEVTTIQETSKEQNPHL
jgi:signal transduction histidine kinase